MKIGVTGTSTGVTPAQLATAWELLSYVNATELHHGDCTGADAACHRIVCDTRLKRRVNDLPFTRIIIHPPDNDTKRAFCREYDDIREPLPYLVRNRAIVAASDLLVAIPRTAAEELRSGTWATIRYARDAVIPVMIIEPDGSWRLNKV